MLLRYRLSYKLLKRGRVLCYHGHNRRNRSHVCIVGSGPAGFYAAQQVLKVCFILKYLLTDLTSVPHLPNVRLFLAENKLDVSQMMTFIFERQENIVIKGKKKCWLPASCSFIMIFYSLLAQGC